MILAGADGCRRGWVRVWRRARGRRLHAACVADAAELIDLPDLAALAIDIPIGLTRRGPRRCDAEARKLLGRPGASSVFPTPVRAALRARSRAEADAITRRVDGRGVGAQAFGLWPKIREVDRVLSRDPTLQQRVRESHPELAFRVLAGAPLPSKHTHAGIAARIDLVDAHFGPGTFEAVRGDVPRGAAADDDVLDALACLWITERIWRGTCVVLPPQPEADARGLRMEIVY